MSFVIGFILGVITISVIACVSSSHFCEGDDDTKGGK